MTYISKKKKHYDLYTEIHGSIAINSCRIEFAQKDIILLSEVSIVTYKAGKRTGVENDKFLHFNLSAGTYSIDAFNAKIKVAILQQRQDWKPPQIKDLSLVIPKDYTFIASNNIFYRTWHIKLSHTKHLLIRQLLQYHCHCTANKSAKSKTSWMDNHQICWPACMFLIIKQVFPQSIQSF